jgi:hypothetical protein
MVWSTMGGKFCDYNWSSYPSVGGAATDEF